MKANSAIVIALLLSAHPVRAGIEDSIGVGPKATALGGSYGARPGDWAATFYNPAGLSPGGTVDQPEGFVEAAFGMVYAHPFVFADDRSGAALSLISDNPDTFGLILGTRFDLGSAFDLEGLNAGVAFYLPTNFFAWSTHADTEVQWLFLSDRTQHFAMAAALGYRVTDWLSLGVGIQVLFDLEVITLGQVTEVSNEVDPLTGANEFDVTVRLGEDVTVFGRVAPTAGLLITLNDDLVFGATFRGENFVDDWGYTRIGGVPGLGNLGYTHRFVHYFQPHQLTLAGSLQLSDDLGISADLTYALWSNALSKFAEELPGQYGDTVRPALGFDYVASNEIELMVGYQFVRSPWENFGGPSNLLDNDRHVVSFGMTVDLAEILGDFDTPFALTWALQLTVLVARDEEKDPRRFDENEDFFENPGYPGYTYGGVVPAGSLAMEVGW
jgi:long-chain fatty acid transport protein